MNTFDFDTVIDRRNTNSMKFDFAKENGLPEDVLPLWVADMDFKAPDCVRSALDAAVQHGIFGYSAPMDGYYDAVIAWFRENFNWEPEKDWFIKTPGVVTAVHMAIHALTEPGDRVMIQTPVYYPFYRCIQGNGRTLVENPLIYKDGHYEIDFEDFERKIVEQQVKMFILCSPHNPVCRVWTQDELQHMGSICHQHGVFVVSDEIHCDFAFPEYPHTIFLQANPYMQEECMILTAPSKSFNLAGLQVSNNFLPNAEKRALIKAEMGRCGCVHLNAMGIIACQAAYEGGLPWLNECRAYLRANLDYLRAFLRDHLPEIRLVEPEGTYFAWLDCSGLGLSRDELNDLIVNRARLWLDAGHIFGEAAEQFQRIVLACPRETLEKALYQLEGAVAELREEQL